MRLRVSCLTEFAVTNVRSIDLHEEFGLARLVEEDGKVVAYLNNFAISSWTKERYSSIDCIKWFRREQIIAYPVERTVAIVSAECCRHIEAGWPYKLFLSRNNILVCYTEEQFFSYSDDDLEGNILSIISFEGALTLRLRELLDRDPDANNLIEVEAGYTFNDNFVFVAYDSDRLWILDAAMRTYKKVPALFSMVGINVLTGDAKMAYAIFDHRNLIQHYPDRPPFELAVFDLVAETAAKQSFVPVEAALIAAGFDMSEIAFQPNATGRIIVSDKKQAALLEFSDLP